MLEALKNLEKRTRELDRLLSDPEVLADPEKLRIYGKEHSQLSEIMAVYEDYKGVLKTLEEDQTLLEQTEEEELIDLAKAEIEELEGEREQLENRLKRLLIPKDPDDSRNTIVEIRAGTGGEEAALFAGDLVRMYNKYAESQGWRVEIMSANPTGKSGFKEIIFLVTGRDTYGKLKYESGVHRVQRVPTTEASGRIHTSAASVAVLPEAEEVDIHINPEDLRIDVFRSSGPGGQSVNTTDSAVRITHIPSGIVVSCQDEKSQHKNRTKAMKILRSRLLDRARQEQHEKIAQDRRAQVKSGDRSDKIRTYNFPQGRVTDHRIGLTLYQLDRIMEGALDEIIEALAVAEQTDKIAAKEAAA